MWQHMLLKSWGGARWTNIIGVLLVINNSTTFICCLLKMTLMASQNVNKTGLWDLVSGKVTQNYDDHQKSSIHWSTYSYFHMKPDFEKRYMCLKPHCSFPSQLHKRRKVINNFHHCEFFTSQGFFWRRVITILTISPQALIISEISIMETLDFLFNQ